MSDPATIDWWKLAELIGVWAAAWATFYAARVSLRIAGQQDEARLKVTVVAGLEGGNGNGFKDVVWITVTNVARRAVTIDYVGWRSSQFVKTRMLQKVDPPNATLPVKLLDGEKWSLILLVEKSGREGWYQMMAEQFLKYSILRRAFELYRFRFEAHCTTGEIFEKRPDAEFLRLLGTAIETKLKRRNEGTKA